jgi:hypothetical protein
LGIPFTDLWAHNLVMKKYRVDREKWDQLLPDRVTHAQIAEACGYKKAEIVTRHLGGEFGQGVADTLARGLTTLRTNSDFTGVPTVAFGAFCIPSATVRRTTPTEQKDPIFVFMQASSAQRKEEKMGIAPICERINFDDGTDPRLQTPPDVLHKLGAARDAKAIKALAHSTIRYLHDMTQGHLQPELRCAKALFEIVLAKCFQESASFITVDNRRKGRVANIGAHEIAGELDLVLPSVENAARRGQFVEFEATPLEKICKYDRGTPGLGGAYRPKHHFELNTHPQLWSESESFEFALVQQLARGSKEAVAGNHGDMRELGNIQDMIARGVERIKLFSEDNISIAAVVHLKPEQIRHAEEFKKSALMSNAVEFAEKYDIGVMMGAPKSEPNTLVDGITASWLRQAVRNFYDALTAAQTRNATPVLRQEITYGDRYQAGGDQTFNQPKE